MNNQLTRERYIQIIEEIRNRINNARYTCMCPQCNEKAINSHVFQRKRIIKQITTNGKVYAFILDDFFNLLYGRNPIKYEHKGAKESFSFYGFCQKHDNDLFLPIENDDVDWTDVRCQYLLGYKTICREIRIKQKAFTYLDEVSKTFVWENELEYIPIIISKQKKDIERTLPTLEQYKRLFEQGIFKTDYSKYKFKLIALPFCLDLCLASPITIAEENRYAFIPKTQIVDTVNIVNIFPYNNQTFILLGFLDGMPNTWCSDIYNALQSNDRKVVANTLQDIMFRSDFNCISEKLYNNIKDKLPLFYEEWRELGTNFNKELSYNSDLFSEYIKGI